MAAVTRLAERLDRDATVVDAILDEALLVHVGVIAEGRPIVVPAVHARIGRRLYLHGSVLARWAREANGCDVCVSATLVDGLVLARSAYQHTMNYRSVLVQGRAVTVDDHGERHAALGAIVEHACPGRSAELRPSTEAELRATVVVRVPLDGACAKVRTGPPRDFERDLSERVWAGTVPLRVVREAPVDDPLLAEGIVPPASVLAS